MENVEVKTENNISTIYLNGRIDTSNASVVDAQINANALSNSIVIDMENLEYISSAGLRMILRLVKKHRDTKVINASSSVYEILDMTGFTSLMNVEKAYKRISVEGCEVIGEGANGKVYRIDEETIVKVYKNPDSLDDIINERTLAKKAFILGIPTAISYDIVKVGNGYASVFEKLTAKSLAKLTQLNPENVDTYTQISVELLKLIHETEVMPNEMPLMKPTVMTWLKRLENALPKDTLDKLYELVENTNHEYNLLHGDYHFKNVMIQDGEAMLIDMDTLCTGHPIFEFGSIYNAYQGFGMVDHSVVEKFLGIPYDTATRIWKKTLEYYLETEDQEKVASVANKAKLVGTIRLMQRGIRVNESQEFIDSCRNTIITLANEIDTLEFE